MKRRTLCSLLCLLLLFALSACSGGDSSSSVAAESSQSPAASAPAASSAPDSSAPDFPTTTAPLYGYWVRLNEHNVGEYVYFSETEFGCDVNAPSDGGSWGQVQQITRTAEDTILLTVYYPEVELFGDIEPARTVTLTITSPDLFAGDITVDDTSLSGDELSYVYAGKTLESVAIKCDALISGGPSYQNQSLDALVNILLDRQIFIHKYEMPTVYDNSEFPEIKTYPSYTNDWTYGQVLNDHYFSNIEWTSSTPIDGATLITFSADTRLLPDPMAIRLDFVFFEGATAPFANANGFVRGDQSGYTNLTTFVDKGASGEIALLMTDAHTSMFVAIIAAASY